MLTRQMLLRWAVDAGLVVNRVVDAPSHHVQHSQPARTSGKSNVSQLRVSVPAKADAGHGGQLEERPGVTPKWPSACLQSNPPPALRGTTAAH
jgi:hypothetical protein